jgi:hypothetical protein
MCAMPAPQGATSDFDRLAGWRARKEETTDDA